MFVGHYSASFVGKAVEPRIPLWVLFLAVQFLDVLWGIFVLLGIEKVRIVPGITASSPLDLYYMPYTHSLVGALGWSALAFVVWQFFPKLGGRRVDYRWPAFILEIAVLVGGAALYAKSAPRKGRIVGYVCALVLVQVFGTFFFPPPASDRAEALMALFFYALFAMMAWWADGTRGSGHRYIGASEKF